jgi:hypothetical protein
MISEAELPTERSHKKYQQTLQTILKHFEYLAHNQFMRGVMACQGRICKIVKYSLIEEKRNRAPVLASMIANDFPFVSTDLSAPA